MKRSNFTNDNSCGIYGGREWGVLYNGTSTNGPVILRYRYLTPIGHIKCNTPPFRYNGTNQCDHEIFQAQKLLLKWTRKDAGIRYSPNFSVMGGTSANAGLLNALSAIFQPLFSYRLPPGAVVRNCNASFVIGVLLSTVLRTLM